MATGITKENFLQPITAVRDGTKVDIGADMTGTPGYIAATNGGGDSNDFVHGNHQHALVADSNVLVQKIANNIFFHVDAGGDYWQYDQPNNIWRFRVGGVTYLQIDAGGITIIGDVTAGNIVTVGNVDGIDVSAHAVAESGVHGAGNDSLATDADIATHTATVAAHHTRYTDAEAIAAVPFATYISFGTGWEIFLP